MFNHTKYEKKYYLPPQLTYDWVQKKRLKKPLFSVVLIYVMATKHLRFR